MSEMTGGLSDPIERGAWSEKEKEPQLPYSERMLAAVTAEVAAVTEAEIAAAEQALPNGAPMNLGELGSCPPEVRKLYGYIQKLSSEYGFDESVPTDVRVKRQIASMLSYGALEAAFPTPASSPGQPWVTRGWRVVFVPEDMDAATGPAGRA